MKTISTWISLLSISCAVHSFATDDIVEHLPTLQAKYEQYQTDADGRFAYVNLFRELARECSAVAEVATQRSPVTWSLMLGLYESDSPEKSYTSVVNNKAWPSTLRLAQQVAKANDISFNIIEDNAALTGSATVDLLHIAGLQTYAHLSSQLEDGSSHANRYITVLCSDPALAFEDDASYEGDWSEYPEFIDRSKKGLWTAIEDFMQRHPEWQIKHQQLDSYGVTVLAKANKEEVVADEAIAVIDEELAEPIAVDTDVVANEITDLELPAESVAIEEAIEQPLAEVASL